MKPLSATEAVVAIEAGKLTSETLVRACLDRIAEREPTVKAWAYLNSDLALAQAKAADAAKGGVLRGVPVGVKDIIDTHDMPTGHNSPIFQGKVPFGDAACIALCRTANAVILGKTVTTEFANRHPGPTTNPHNAAHTPGGSSSGSAAAVADGHVPLAFGTQTGGSVIRPAAFCGVIGYKPTFGDFSRVGIKMQCHSLDTLGLMARTLDDIALFRGAVLKLAPVKIDRSPLNSRGARPRIGFCRTPVWDDASGDTKALLQRAASQLADKGAAMIDVAFAAPFADILDDHGAIMGWESVRNYVCPSAPGEAPEGVEFTGDPRFNSIWTLAGTPCVTLPAGAGAKGLPLGIQLVGRRHEDDRLLATAAWVAGHLN